MRRAVYPGSFDPVTFGHLDIIERSASLVDELIVGVLVNRSKTPLFSADERVKMLIDVTRNIPNVSVRSFSGLSVDFVRECEAGFIVRGLRAITDFEYELQMAQTNRIMNKRVDTIFLTTSLDYAYLSSSIVREVAVCGGSVDKFVPEYVSDMIGKKLEFTQGGN